MIKLNKILLILSLYLISNSTIAFGQLEESLNIPQNSVIVGITYQYASHSAGFTEFSGCPTCLDFDNLEFSNTNGYNYGFLFGWEHRLSKSFSLQMDANYLSSNVNFVLDQAFLTRTAEDEKIYVQHELNTNISSVNISLSPKIYLLQNLALGIGVSTQLITTANYNYSERLVNSFNKYSFDGNGSIVRNTKPEGTSFENFNSLLIGFRPLLTYQLEIGNSFYVEPNLSYNLAITDFLDEPNVSWKFSSINFGLNLHYVLDYLETETTSLPDCPKGFVRDKYGNCIENNEGCPEGYKQDFKGECVPICPEGYKYDSNLNECIKLKNCPDGYKYIESTLECVLNLPTFDKNCTGTYLAIIVKDLDEGEYLSSILKNKMNNVELVIVTEQDLIDNRVNVLELQTGCFDSEIEAIKVQRAIYSILWEKTDMQIDANEIEIILRSK